MRSSNSGDIFVDSSGQFQVRFQVKVRTYNPFRRQKGQLSQFIFTEWFFQDALNLVRMQRIRVGLEDLIPTKTLVAC